MDKYCYYTRSVISFFLNFNTIQIDAGITNLDLNESSAVGIDDSSTKSDDI